MTKTTKTAAPEKRDDSTDEPVTKLAQIGDPAKLTNAKIDEIAGEHSDKTDPEQSANVDVAETLKQAKTDAKSDDAPAPTYFHGQGGAAGV